MAHQSVFPYSKSHAMPEPMNAASHHPKIKLSITPGEPLFVAGTHVTGKLEMECRAEGEKGLGIGVVMVELFATEELTSRDHLATSTFLHSRRLFQGPDLPPSNAVLPYPLTPSQDAPPLPQHYLPARRGRSTFFFSIPLPGTSPGSISFAYGQAKVKYELRGSAGVFWKNEKRLVVCRKAVEVIERFAVEEAMVVDLQGGGMNLKVPEAVVVGESGKLWMHGRILSGLVVAGGSAFVELQVKNHSTKKNTSLTLLLTRTLYLRVSSANNSQSPPPLQISDTLVTVPFRGPEYIIPPGAEGVANLVFDIPKEARGVRGGTLDGEELEGQGQLRITESLFEIRCMVEVKLGMGMGSKDIRLEIPIDIIHPKALPEDPNPLSPTSYVDQQQIWMPPPVTTPYPYAMSPPIASQPTGLGLTFGLGVPYMHTGTNQIPLPISPPPQAAQPPILFANHDLLLQQPFHLPPHLPARSSSAEPIASASQVPQMVPEFPPPELGPIGSFPFPALRGSPAEMHTVDPAHQHAQYRTPSPAQLHHQQPSPTSLALATIGYEPEEGKGEHALRVSRHLRLSSRHRSVSPTSHRYPLPQPPQPAAAQEEQIINYHNIGVSAPHTRTRMLPVPPLVVSPGSPGMVMSPLIPSLEPPPQEETILHSPRPQLTPKHSLTNITDAYNQTTTITKSERVEELEKMADVVVRRSGNDLSGDVPKGVVEKVEEELREQDRDAREVVLAATEKAVPLRRNKTLPGPPPPPPPTLNGNVIMPETEPLPSDQTPPRPTLHALAMRSRVREKDKEKRELLQELRTEDGLDALERRLLREVGTRKMNAPPRPDVRGVLRNFVQSPLERIKERDPGAGTRVVGGGTKSIGSGDRSKPIPIPVKSPEPLNNDSAISSLTLAGRMAEDMDDDQDSDGGRTHRAGSRSSVGRENARGKSRERIDASLDDDWVKFRAHRHIRERAEVVANGRTTTKTLERDDKDKAQNSFTKEKPGAQRKKDTKAKAKGRVAAWLGEIDVGVPPQEQIIPPSPSVVRAPDEMSRLVGDDDDVEEKGRDAEGGTAAPNPRSSGFVPIGSTVSTTTALNRNTIHFNLGLGPSSVPLVTLRDATVVEEAKRVQALWDGGDDLSSLGYAPAQAKTREEATKTPKQAAVVPATTPEAGIFHKFPLSFPPLARMQTIRTDRRVSPPSNGAKEEKTELGMQAQPRAGRASISTPIPMSYSAAAKNAWKTVDHNPGPAGGAALSKKTTHPPFSANNTKAISNAERFPSFPPPSNAKPTLDAEVRYDIRSARGGRGGKVTAVANLWASGAIMDQGMSSTSNKTAAPLGRVQVLSGLENLGRTDREKGREMASRAIEERQRLDVDVLGNHPKPFVKPTPDTKPPAVPTKTQKKTFSAALMSPAPPPPPKPSILAVSGASNAKPKPKHIAEDPKRPDARNVFTKPNPPPSRANISTKRPATATPTPRPGSGAQSPQLSQGGRTTPMPILQTPLSRSSSPDRSKLDMSAYPITTAGPARTGGGLKHKPGMIIPPSTNPASVVLSSSHAVPHLSSTASLARPHVSRNAPPTTVGPASSSNQVAPPTRMFPTMLSMSKSAPSLIDKANETLPALPARVGSPSKPVDLSFGQARLRDLIKKYQGQGS